MTTRKELVRALRVEYANASMKEKTEILDNFVIATGYHRRYAMQLLSNEAPIEKEKKKPGCVTYGEEVVKALVEVWLVASRICGKRLKPFMGEIVSNLQRNGHLKVEEETRAKLLTMSSATIDRLLRDEKKKHARNRYTGRKVPNSIASEVPIKTFSDWKDKRTGYFELDLVAHNGGDASGKFCHTLVLTDVFSGWTDFTAVPDKGEESVVEGLKVIKNRLPMPILGLDSDNGGEFMNQIMKQYRENEGIRPTRSRPYKKNDQCYVEEKNGSIIRNWVGYRRYEGPEDTRHLAEFYSHLRVYVNYFQPSMQLKSKQHHGSKVTKTYHPAITPARKLIDQSDLLSSTKERLDRCFKELDLLELLNKVQSSLKKVNRDKAEEPTIEKKPKGRQRGWRKVDTLAPILHEILSEAPWSKPLEVQQILREQFPAEPNNVRYLRARIIAWRDAHPEYMEHYPKLYRKFAHAKGAGKLKECSTP